MRPLLTHLLSALVMLCVLAGCRGQVSEEPPIVPIRNMYNQPRYDSQSHSDYFSDGRTMRPPIEGTIAREMEIDQELVTGRLADDSGWVLEVPTAILREFGSRIEAAERGQERYDIACAPCHGISGAGDGLVSQRASSIGAAALSPPTFHSDRVRHMPDGQLYATITNGIRKMPSYRHNVSLEDRWAIVAYMRALQISQLDVASDAEAN